MASCDSSHKMEYFLQKVEPGSTLRDMFSEKCGVSKLYPPPKKIIIITYENCTPPPPPLAITIFKMHRSNFRAITRFETLAK